MNKSSFNPFKGWAEADWKMELQRVLEQNEQLNRALNQQQESNCQSQQHNELLEENFDLKSTIGRIRYGKPVRSLDDRNKINRLEIENQELRTQVGKLRYKTANCVTQPVVVAAAAAGHANKSTPDHSIRKDIWKDFDSLNLTEQWHNIVQLHGRVQTNVTRSSVDQFEEFRRVAARLVDDIEFRRQELVNISQQNKKSKIPSQLKEALQKSADKVFDLTSEMFAKSSKAAKMVERVAQITEKLESRWNYLTRNLDEKKHSSASVRKADGEKKSGRKIDEEYEEPLTASKDDWFLSMGKEREKLRNNNHQQQQHQNVWLFERAQSRQEERHKKHKNGDGKSTKKQSYNKPKNHRDSKKKDDNPWNHFSA